MANDRWKNSKLTNKSMANDRWKNCQLTDKSMSNDRWKNSQLTLKCMDLYGQIDNRKYYRWKYESMEKWKIERGHLAV